MVQESLYYFKLNGGLGTTVKLITHDLGQRFSRAAGIDGSTLTVNIHFSHGVVSLSKTR